MPVTIRPLEPADRAAWNPLWQGYLTFYETDLDPAVTEITWARLMREGEDPNGFAALNEAGEMIGFTHYLYHRSTWSNGPYCYLEDLYVSEAARGTGAGRALIEAVAAKAEEDGAERLYWNTQSFNETARRLYDQVAALTPFVQYRR